MARSGVQYEDVQRAIEALQAKGEAPSVQKIREVLGTGSFTTISDHLREWRNRRETNRESPTPLALPESVQRLVEGLWGKAQEEAGEALGRYREEADRQVADAKEAMLSAQRLVEDAEQRETALAAHLAGTEQRLEQRSAALAKAEAEREQALERASQLAERLTRSLQQLDQLQVDSEQQAQAYQQGLAERDAQHQARLNQEEQRHESAEARLMGLLDEARQERLSNEKRHQAALQQMEKRQEALQRQLHETQAVLAQEEKRHRETQWAKTRAEERIDTLRHEHSLLQARIDDQKRHLDEQAGRIRALEQELSRRIWQEPGERHREEAAESSETEPSATER
ncbi:DNA-binding protein [Halomonas sp. E19]|uniref:DNA-binding protein n=1 Tax=unclassified Halomonas TaxID=2609666 RepID=UPI0040336618